MNDPDSTRETADRILELFRRRNGQRLGIDGIRKLLSGDHEDIAGALEMLLSDGTLWRVRKGRYALSEELGITRGMLRVRPGGSGFVSLGGRERIQIDRRNLGTAMDGDTVLVRRLDPVSDTEYSGRIEGVLQRGHTGISGITRGTGKGFVICPLDPRMPDRIPLRTGGRSVEPGRIVYADLDFSGKHIRAVLRRTIGDPSSPSALIDAVVADSGAPVEFPLPVIEEAQAVSVDPPGESEQREDFRDQFTVTIDPADARDFDDAISLSTDSDGNSVLGVHIADVSAFVTPGSLLDREAALRGTSIYLPDRVIPMLPEILSNGSCSLKPGEDRLAVSVLITLDEEGNRSDFSVSRSVIRSDYRLTYTEVLGIIEERTECDQPLRELILKLDSLSSLLQKKREERGALDLGSMEFRTVFDKDGWPEGFDTVPDDRSHRLIENFMIEANRAVADYCGWIPLRVLYRVHGDPSSESVDELRNRLVTLGIDLPSRSSIHSSELNRILESAADSPAFPLVRDMVLRSMQKAVYSPENDGHYGLALESYLHFTSPIRRYPDLIAHQALGHYAAGTTVQREKPMSDQAFSAGYTERRAESMERAATELMGLLYLSRKMGEVFPGVVSGVKDFGIFVRLVTVPAEGLVPLRFLRKSGYYSTTLFGEGESINVEIAEADPVQRTLAFFPADHPEGRALEDD